MSERKLSQHSKRRQNVDNSFAAVDIFMISAICYKMLSTFFMFGVFDMSLRRYVV